MDRRNYDRIQSFRRQAAERTDAGPVEQAPDATAQALARINTLTRTAKTSWFGLLSYIAFVGVTLMGVADADFFIPERQTELPLIGVSIPTFLFFWVAPALGAALYAYFHMHLLKLWEALGEAEPAPGGRPLSDQAPPWLVTDFALAWRKGALAARPMRVLALGVTWALAFLAAPLLLAFFFWRSMPAHEEWLTIVGCGLPLALTLYIGRGSWAYMVRRMRGRPEPGRLRRWARVPVWALVTAAIVAIGWLTTEGAFDHYARTHFGYAAYRDLNSDWVDPTDGKWWADERLNRYLVSADLAGVDFVNVPEDWRDFQTAREVFRVAWCDGRGIPAAACGPGSPWGQADMGEQERVALRKARQNHCADLHAAYEDDEESLAEWCDGLFASYDADFTSATRRSGEDRAWEVERTAQRNRLAPRDLSRRDFRGADLRGARMEGADLSWVRMEGADLTMARMEGADLFMARVIRADLYAAHLEGADFTLARMESADLTRARMEGAVLVDARMEGTNLREAHMHGANLRIADVQYAAMKYSDLSETNLDQNQVKATFGDGSVTDAMLPPGVTRPAHWPRANLPISAFYGEWEKWKADPEGYVPP